MISARSFFKTGKFRSRRTKHSQDSTTSLQTSRNASIDTTNTVSSSWTAPIRFSSILEKPTLRRETLPSLDPDSFSQSSKHSDDTMREPVNFIPPFQGLPTTQSISPALLEEDEYRALGLRTPDIQRTQAHQNGSRAHSPKMPSEDESVDELFEMDVPTQIPRGNRPDLQVSIPAKTPPLRSPRLLGTRNGGPTPPSAMSTPSSLPTGTHLRSATTTTPHSIVSPLTGVEMPKPNRPFSTESIEGVSKHSTPTPKQRLAGRHHKAERSRRASISSDYTMETPHPGETPVVANATTMRIDSTNLYHASLVPTGSKLKKSVTVNEPTMQRKGSTVSVTGTINESTMQRKGSTVSMTANININKPLPPEPPAGSTRYGTSPTPPRHIAYTASTSPSGPHQTHSRSNSTSKRANPSPQIVSEPPSPESRRSASVDVTRRGSQPSITRSATLRSKYTPKDLDSMDEVFQRRTENNSTFQTPTVSRSRASPNQSQASLADANHLSTITETSPRTSHALGVKDVPLHVSRGPMRMEPSRRPPQPPSQTMRVHTIDIDKVGRKAPAIGRTKSNNSINTTGKSPRKRSSTLEQNNGERRTHESKSSGQLNTDRRASEWPSVENINSANADRRIPERTNTNTERLSKADRVLGIPGASAISRPTYNIPPRVQEPLQLAQSFEEESDDEAFYEIRGRQDAQFEEIENRLKLLSPKEDSAAAFDAFHQANAQSYAKQQSKASPKEPTKSEGSKPTIEDKLHLSGTLRDDPIVPTFIAELEAHRTPSPVELQGSDAQVPVSKADTEKEPDRDVAELGLPSPDALAAIPIPPEPVEPLNRGVHPGSSRPISSTSGKTKSLHSARSVRVRSLASIAASDIPDYYATSPTPNSHSKRPSTAGSEVEEVITADAAERVLLHILQSLDNLEDLFAAAFVSKGFYRTFKRHELYLLKHAIWKMSPAAWELRQMSIPYPELEPGSYDYTPALYFRYYVQDLLTMVELKTMILESCKSFLRNETILALAGETDRSQMIDEAFWRVWTFCKIFGCGTGREDDIVGQMDWLRGGIIAGQSSDTRTLILTDELARNSVLFNPPNGFARGNGKNGLTAEDLYDMIEIWTCLGVLVRGYHGKRKEARDYGVYDKTDVPVGDIVQENAMLVLDVTSPATPTRTQFAQARSQGYTKWTPPKKGMSRSTFLKEAVSRVYEEKMAQKRTKNGHPAEYSTLPSVHPSVGADAAIAAKARIARHAAEIKKQKEDPSYRNVPVSDDRPLSNYSDVLDRLEAISTAADAPPMPKLPGLAARLSRAKSRRGSGTGEVTIARPTSATSTAQSSAASVQNSLTTGTDNLSAADANSITECIKAGKSKMKHPFYRKSEEKAQSKGEASRRPTLRAPKFLDKTKSKKDKTKEAGIEETTPSALIPPSDEKFAVLSEERNFTASSLPPQVRDPVDLAVEKLVGMGFEEDKAKKVLAQTETGNGINFDAAYSRLKKERERKKRLERLETMG